MGGNGTNCKCCMTHNCISFFIQYGESSCYLLHNLVLQSLHRSHRRNLIYVQIHHSKPRMQQGGNNRLLKYSYYTNSWKTLLINNLVKVLMKVLENEIIIFSNGTRWNLLFSKFKKWLSSEC